MLLVSHSVHQCISLLNMLVEDTRDASGFISHVNDSQC